MCVSLFGCNSSLELKSIESLDLKNFYIYTHIQTQLLLPLSEAINVAL